MASWGMPMPKEGVFAIVLKDGTIKCGDKICILSPDEGNCIKRQMLCCE